MQKNSKIKTAVIGVGYLGKFHADKYSFLENSEFVAVVDTDRKLCKKIANTFNVEPIFDYRDLYGKIEAVSVVVPTSLHFKISKNLLLEGVNVLIEKPITESVEEADELIKIAKEKNLIIQVGHLERFNPAVLSITKFIKKPKFIEAHRLSKYKGRSMDVCVILDLMIHDIDFVLSVVKSKIKSISASGARVVSNHIDIANARLSFENGCVANITASRVSMKDERKMRIFQKNQYTAIDFVNKSSKLIKKKEGLDISDIEVQNFSSREKETDALKDEIASFLDSIKQNKTPVITGENGRDALDVALEVKNKILTTI